jgi:hypothetical protein
MTLLVLAGFGAGSSLGSTTLGWGLIAGDNFDRMCWGRVAIVVQGIVWDICT